jgi:hypothetical protein
MASSENAEKGTAKKGINKAMTNGICNRGRLRRKGLLCITFFSSYKMGQVNALQASCSHFFITDRITGVNPCFRCQLIHTKGAAALYSAGTIHALSSLNGSSHPAISLEGVWRRMCGQEGLSLSVRYERVTVPANSSRLESCVNAERHKALRYVTVLRALLGASLFVRLTCPLQSRPSHLPDEWIHLHAGRCS